MLRQAICAALVLLALPTAGRAQTTPEAAAQTYGNAIKANDWAAAARLMHPAALNQLRSLFGPLITSPGGDEIGLQIFGVHSGAEWAAMPDTVLFAMMLRFTMSREAGLAEALQSATIVPLGHVPAGGDTVLVVSRMTFDIGGISLGQFEVMPFLLADGRWWGLLKVDFRNMAAMLQGALGDSES
jgi:hypothetical protein